MFLVAKALHRVFCSSLTKCNPLVLAGKIKGYASFLPLAEEGAAKEEVALDDFLGIEGAFEPSPTRFLPMSIT